MYQRKLLYRWLFYAAASFFLLALQHLALRRVQLWGVHPFLLPVLPAVAAVWEDRQESLCAAAVFGLLCDLLLSPPIPCFYVLLFSVTALLSGLIAAHLIVPGIFCALATSGLALLLNGLLQSLILSYRGVAGLSAAAIITGRELVATLPLVPLVYLVYRLIHRRFPAD